MASAASRSADGSWTPGLGGGGGDGAQLGERGELARPRGPGRARCPARSPRRGRRAPRGRTGRRSAGTAACCARRRRSRGCGGPRARSPPRGARAPSGTCTRARARMLRVDARRARAAPPGRVRSQAAAMRAGMSPGAEERVVVGVEQRHVAAGRLGASAEQRRRSEVVAGLGPGAAALLQQPHAHDVLEQARRAVDAALVGEVRRRGRRRSSTGSGSSRPSSDQVPLESIAACSSRSGAAAKAEAVSWPATA